MSKIIFPNSAVERRASPEMPLFTRGALGSRVAPRGVVSPTAVGSSAKRTHDLVAFSIHAHETAGLADSAVPADFLPLLFHKAIDAGADVVIRHGPHELNGIEIYKGKPIFYSLGSLFFGVGGPDRRSPPADYDSAVAVTEYRGGVPAVVRVYPLKIVTDRPALFSAPVPATGADAQRILGVIQKDSEPFGTRMRIENGVGVIDIAK